MSPKRLISAFDIIGPIMVGPSSSHTAGAVRLGQLGRAILGGQPDSAFLGLHGSFARTGKGHGTDRALVAGLLAMSPDDPRIRNSLQIARQKGMTLDFRTVDLGEDAHPNSVQMSYAGAHDAMKLWGRRWAAAWWRCGPSTITTSA